MWVPCTCVPVPVAHNKIHKPLTMSNKGILKAWDSILYDKFMLWQDFIPLVMEQHFEYNYKTMNPPSENQHIGDLGSGLGNSTFDLACGAPASCVVTGIDCSPKFVEFAQTEEPKKHGAAMQDMLDSGRLRFVCKDVENNDLLAQPDGTSLPAFDALYAVDGTQFYISPVKAFTRMHQALKPNGTLHFTVFRKREANVSRFSSFCTLTVCPPPSPPPPPPTAPSPARARALLSMFGGSRVVTTGVYRVVRE